MYLVVSLGVYMYDCRIQDMIQISNPDFFSHMRV